MPQYHALGASVMEEDWGGAKFYEQVTSVMAEFGGVGQFYGHGEEKKLTGDDKQGGDCS